MSVHSKEHYPKIKELLEIPEDEPIFILRAQDALALSALRKYEELAADMNRPYDFTDGVGDVEEDFMEWQRNNATVVKLPD